MMLTRRALLTLGAACSVLALTPGGLLSPAQAQSAGGAAGFIEGFGNQLVAVVNGNASLSEKQQTLRPLIDQAVDVDTIARFCLGRYVNMASSQQLSEFTKLFHAVLVENITSKIGEYRGVTFKMADTVTRGSDAEVGTIVTRPNEAPTNVRWVVSMASGSPKIIDVIAEGTSLRLTQRSDYSSFLSHHANDVSSLITAMRQQVAPG